ncbi:S9 family peptidase [Telmatobacter sp. DSM 110680]|uniref:S9 family peptidase n=1 Tax=Telmatobacter sp. DSM 110680 TaxID=3036704 RepID=A0AAU7DI42_9BACT
MHKAIIALLLATTFAEAQPAKRPMTFEDMMHIKRLGSTAVSPDGKWLGYSVSTVDLEKNTKTTELWLQPIAQSSEKGGDPIKLAVGQPGDDGLQFAPDNKHILFLSSRELASQQVYTADFDAATGAASNVRHASANWDGVDNARWAPDSQSIAYTAEVYPDCPAIVDNDFATGDRCNMDRDTALRDSKVKAQIFTHLMYRHWNRFTDDKRTHLFLIDVASGAVRDLVPNNPHDVPTDYPTDPLGCGCAFSPDSKELAITFKDVPDEAVSTNSDIFTVDLTNPNAKPVKVSTSPGGDMSPAYSPDGKYLAWRSQLRPGYESDRFRLLLYDRATKTARDLLPKFDNWVDEFAWSPRSPNIYFTSGNRGEVDLYFVNVDGTGAAINLGVTGPELYADGAEFSGIIPVPHKFEMPTFGVPEQIIATRMKADSPSEAVVLWPGGTSSKPKGQPVDVDDSMDALSRRVTHLNDALLAQLDQAPLESFWFPAADGTKVQGFLIKPPAFDPNKKYPVKFLIHGGPQGAWGDSWSYRWNAELFAANGYVVIMINPGGSTGYGQAFVDRVNGDWGGKPFTDLMIGLTYAEQHYPFIDKTRECALGASYGGYMANWVLGHTNRFKCIVSHDGMYNAESAFGTTEEDWFNQWEFKGNPWDYYGKPDSENPFRKWSPSLSAKNFKTPTLVVHGQLDYRLDVSEGYQLFDTLQLLHVPSKMLYFPDEGHWVLKPQNSQLWYKTVNDWVDQWTKEAGK